MSTLSDILGFDPQDALADAAGRMVQAAQVADAALALAAEAAGLPVSETGDELVTVTEVAVGPFLAQPNEMLVKIHLVEPTDTDTIVGSFGDRAVASLKVGCDIIDVFAQVAEIGAQVAAIDDSLDGAGSLPSDQQVDALTGAAADFGDVAATLSTMAASFFAEIDDLRAKLAAGPACHDYPPPGDVGIAVVGQADANYIFTGADLDRA